MSTVIWNRLNSENTLQRRSVLVIDTLASSLQTMTDNNSRDHNDPD
ncbi:hypothetical protein NJ7G_1499 [Natrinema sp. J7-2]|nr:hypothetical protein NJ7G_1499 [Natrinema sp. J7-2]